MLVKDIWKNTTIFCKKDNSELVLNQVNNNLFYACPVCKSKLSVAEFEKVTDYLCDLESDRQIKEIDYTGHKFRRGKLNSYEVVNEGGGKWEINWEKL